MLMFVLFAGESVQSPENKMFNFRLFCADLRRYLFIIDDPYVANKLKSGEPNSARFQTEPMGKLVCCNNLTHDFLFKNNVGRVETLISKDNKSKEKP